MTTFKKIRKGLVSTEYSRFQNLQEAFIRWLKKQAAFLNTRVAPWSARKKSVVLVFFCLCSALINGAILLSALSASPSGSHPGLKIRQTPLPTHIGKSGELPGQNPARLSDSLLIRLQGLKAYLDSLQDHDSLAYGPLVEQRSRLIDSIEWLENMISKNHKY